VRYLKMAIWPSKLVAFYPHPSKLFPAWQVGAAATLLVAITVVVLRARRQRYLAVGWLWFLGSLVPMIGLVQVGEQALADRYAYISFVGLFVMVVWLVADWAQGSRQISPRWLAVPAVGCLLAFGIFTYRQVGYWHDSESFFRRTIALTEDNLVAHKGLAQLFYTQGKNREAIAEVRTALAIRPDDAPGNLILGDYEFANGNVNAAMEHYQMTANQARGAFLRSRAYGKLGYLYRQKKQPMKAKQCFEMSLRAVPNQPIIMVQLGLIAELDENDAATAVRYFTRAMQLQPTDVGLILLANALAEEGESSESDKALERAAKLSKDMDAAQEQARSLLEDQSGSLGSN